MSPHDLVNKIDNLVTETFDTITFFFNLIWNMDLERWFGWFLGTGLLMSVLLKIQELLTKKLKNKEEMRSFVELINSTFVNYFFGILSFVIGFYLMSVSNWK
jgi:hypothetical protein